eukprot:TRINITY_DN913_c0_g1_i2.p1 TRINITY_DN913_c0_g1~~TRINITY_DN913_c0_g1_i2.p1  ORF type:complete len:167 (-),score=26.12 TRINITY_DN913_c0_g1_i2:335-835(-)
MAGLLRIHCLGWSIISGFIVWGFLLFSKIVFVTIFPTVIQPCFNKVEALAEGDLRTKIENLAKRVGFPLKSIFQMDGSKRSAHSNAYMYGFFNSKHIVIFDTLIKHSTEEEIVAILGHEIGHWKMSHTLKMLIFGVISIGCYVLFVGQAVYTKELYEAFGFSTTQP